MKNDKRDRRYRAAYWRNCLSAPYASADMAPVVLSGMLDLPSDVEVRVNPRTGLAWWLRGSLMPDEVAHTDTAREALAFNCLQKYVRPLLGYKEVPDTYITESLPGQRVRLRQTMRQSDGRLTLVYGASLLFGFDREGHLTWVSNSCYMIAPRLSMPPTDDYLPFADIQRDITPLIQDRLFLMLPPEIRGEIISPGITQTLQEILDQYELDLDGKQQYTLSQISIESLNHSFFEPLAGDVRLRQSLRRLPVRGDDLHSQLRTELSSQFEGTLPSIEPDKVTAVTDTFLEKQLDQSLPQATLQVRPNTIYEEGQVIFPVLNDNGQPDYRPAWSTISYEERAGVEWEVVVSRQLEGEYEILAAGDRTAGSITLVEKGGNNGTFMAIDQPGERDNFIQTTLNTALELFNALRDAATLDTISMPGDADTLNVVLRMSRTQYLPQRGDHAGRRIEISGKDESKQIGDRGKDPQVLYHEYAHAVVDNVQPDFYDNNLTSAFNQAMNEGFAFYFGCALHDRQDQPPNPSQWGQIAYADPIWQVYHDLSAPSQPGDPGYHFLPAYHVFPDYEGECKYPFALQEEKQESTRRLYACGILWARALWDVRKTIGENADHLILRALRLCNGPQDMETAAEAILHELEQIGHPNRDQVHQQFIQRRILPAAPIYDLATIALNGRRHTLAATARAGGGCFISSTQDWAWQVLGTNCPDNVVALTTLELSPNEQLVFIASETAGDGIDTRFHFCRLRGNGDSFQVVEDWQTIAADSLPELSSRLVFSLTAVQTVNGFHLFVGTESDLYWFDGQWHHIQIGLNPTPLFQVSITPASQLMVAGWGVLRTYALPLLAIANPTAKIGENGLSNAFVMTALPTGNAWLAGLGVGNVSRFDGVNWSQQMPDNPARLTVYDLLSREDGILYAGTSDGLYWYDSPQNSWQPLRYRLPSGWQVHLLNNQSVLSLCSWEANNRFNLLAATAQGDIQHFVVDSINGDLAMARPLPQ